MKKLTDLTYGIVGLGIMGGSLAKAIRLNILSRTNASGKIYACNRSQACLLQAESEGIVDKTFSTDKVADMLRECDFVFVCLYPHATLDFLEVNKDAFKSGAIVTDISGVKGIFEKKLPAILRDDVDFIIGHPMAGGEKEGYANSKAEFFIGRNYILIPQAYNKKENLDLMKLLVSEMGFSRITITDCDTHDYKIAFTSQLCHVIASALVESAKDEEITAFGGGSFEDLTRIAMINAPLWTELFISNKEKLLGHIEEFEKRIDQFKVLIENSDSKGLCDLLEDVRQKRIIMGSVKSLEKNAECKNTESDKK